MKVMKKLLLILAVILVAAVYANGIWPRPIYDTSIGSNSYEDSGFLDTGSVIEQKFKCTDAGFCGFSVKITLMDNQSVGTYRWIIQEIDSGKQIGEGIIDETVTKNKNFESSNPQKRGIVEFDFPRQQDSKGKDYLLRIEADTVSAGKGMAVYITEKDNSENELIINGQESDKASVVNLQYSRFNVETFIVFLGIMLYLAVFIKFMYKLFK